MKFLKFFLSVILAFTSIVVFNAPSRAAELSVSGGQLSWDESTFFEPTGCSSFTFNYFNGTGIRLLQFKMEIKGRFGDKLTDRSVIGMPVGVTGAWSVQICKHQLTDGLGPYTVSLQVEDYNGSVRSTQGQLFFKSRTATATPTPTPTPTITPTAPAPSPRATSGAGDAANLTIPSLRLRLSAKSALVSWSSVFDAEGFEANYEVRITRRNSSTYGDWRETNFATSFQFAKLTPGAKYSVQVRTKTDSGTGKPKVISFRAR